MNDENQNDRPQAKNQPALDLFFESDDRKRGGYPVRIGALFSHRDGKGHSIDDNGVLGISGRLFTRDTSERLERLKGDQDQVRGEHDRNDPEQER